MKLKTYRDLNGNYNTYKTVPPTFRITVNDREFNPETTAILGPEKGLQKIIPAKLQGLHVIENVD